MRSIKFPKNPYVLFFPFLILYIIYVSVFSRDVNYGDQGMYLKWAEYLLTVDFKEPLNDNGSIPNGPGYPIILIPFVLFKLPLICITLLNALLYYFSIILIFKSLQLLVQQRIAVLTSLFWAFYINSFISMRAISPEVFTSFLVALLTYSVVKTFTSIEVEKVKKYLIISGITLGFIILTKVIFGYVVYFLLFGSVILWLINKKSANLSRVLMILLISIGLTIPYLTYTYYHTGKIFYWATSGGVNLYWMSTPYEGEYGSYISFESLKQKSTFEQNGIYVYNDSNISNHLKVWEEIENYNRIQQDDKLKSIAINNIKKHPVKFLQNWISNVGRILLNNPYSYNLQKPRSLFFTPLNGIIIVLLLFSLVPTYKYWHKINFGIRFLILFSLVYLGGSTLGSAESRMFAITAPVLLLWIAFILQNTIKINLKFNTVLPNTHENH
ncbi:glycosyltransferase family 39 protein [Lutimonas vermicola]|uniref:Glycosyltransferase family 39 protein n=1 Tax=Lutimonas vermicola TaxID=414288 RepID=A0ABU9L3Y9_9FLAO